MTPSDFSHNHEILFRKERDAREAVFVVNEELRRLHLNLQGSKTEVLSGDDLVAELDNSDLAAVDEAYTAIRELDHRRPANAKRITKLLKPLGPSVSRFRSGLPESVAKLTGKENRLFRRLMTVYGRCQRPHFRKAAIAAMKQLPDLRILRKTLQYLSYLDYGTHDQTLDEIVELLETDELPFPYQAGVVLETVANLHPSVFKTVGSRIRSYALTRVRHWFVVQRALGGTCQPV